MANIKPVKGNILVRWLPENDKPELSQTSEPRPYQESELCQLEVLSGPNEGKIALASQWSLSQLVPGTEDQYFIEETSIEGYTEAPISEASETEDYND